MADAVHLEQCFTPLTQGLLACWVAAKLTEQPTSWSHHVKKCARVLSSITQHPTMAAMLKCTAQACTWFHAAKQEDNAAVVPLFLLPTMKQKG